MKAIERKRICEESGDKINNGKRGSRTFFPLRLLWTAFALTLLSFAIYGCNSVRYEGISLEALPADATVEFFSVKQQIPKPFEVLGRAQWISEPRVNDRIMRKVLRDAALEHGANGILLLSVKRIPAGEAREDQIDNLPAPGWDIEDNSNSTYTYVYDSIWYADDQDPEMALYRYQVNALFLHLTGVRDGTEANASDGGGKN